MNDQEITQFTTALQDFMLHAEKEIQSYLEWQEARSWMNDYYEDLASKYEVPVDYILAEFVV